MDANCTWQNHDSTQFSSRLPIRSARCLTTLCIEAKLISNEPFLECKLGCLFVRVTKKQTDTELCGIEDAEGNPNQKRV